MSESSGLNFLHKLLGFSPAAEVASPPSETIISPENKDDYGTSTIQKSQKDQDQENSMNASIPWLPPFLMVNDATYSFDAMKAKIIDFMMKKWGESNKEVEEANRQKILDEIRSGVDKLFQSNVIPGINIPLSAGEASKIATKGAIPQAEKTGKAENVAGAATNREGESAEKIAGIGILIMMISGVAMMGAPGAAIGVGQPGLSVVGEMITSVILPAGIINNDMKGELNQLSTLMLVPMFYPAMAKALAAAKGSGEKLDLAFAKANLTQVSLLVTDKNFDLFLRSIISAQMPNVRTEEQKNLLLHTAKLMMLYAALATYYEVETGWTSGQEIGDMVNGKLFLENHDDPRFGVIALIKQEFHYMGLTDEAAEKLNQKFAAYLGDKNSIDEFISPSRLFEEMSVDLQPERIRNRSE